MEYEAVQAKERLTGRGYFTPTGQAGAIDLGNVEMLKLDYSPKRKQHFKARRGKLVLDRDDAYGVEPKFTITGDEFTTPMLALLFLGTANADFVQSSGTGVSFSFTAKLGQSFHVGAFDISNVVMTTPTGKVAGSDFIVDGGPGRIYIPLQSTIADGAAVTVTFSKAALTFDSIDAFTQLNRLGTLQVIEEQEYTAAPKTIYDFSCSLSTDSSGETKADDYKKFTLIATLTSQLNGTMMTVRKLK